MEALAGPGAPCAQDVGVPGGLEGADRTPALTATDLAALIPPGAPGEIARRSPWPRQGGKARLLSWILPNLPPAPRLYVEPFLGTGAVLTARARTGIEVGGDAHGRICNFFRVLRDHPGELLAALTLTPFSEADFGLSKVVADDPLEDARRWWVLMRSCLRGMEGERWKGVLATTQAVVGGHVSMVGEPVSETAQNSMGLAGMAALAQRLRGVVVHHCDGITLLDRILSGADPAAPVSQRFGARENRYTAGAETLVYADPPYPETKGYSGMDPLDHEALLDRLLALSDLGVCVAVSGFDHPVYRDRLAEWDVSLRPRINHLNAKRVVEMLWLSPAIRETRAQRDLFEGAT